MGQPTASSTGSGSPPASARPWRRSSSVGRRRWVARSEEHTSELQSRQYLVCRLLLEKKRNPCPCLPLTRPPRPRLSACRPSPAPPELFLPHRSLLAFLLISRPHPTRPLPIRILLAPG